MEKFGLKKTSKFKHRSIIEIELLLWGPQVMFGSEVNYILDFITLGTGSNREDSGWCPCREGNGLLLEILQRQVVEEKHLHYTPPRLLFLSPASLLSLQPLPTAASASARSRGSRRGLKSECDFHKNPIIKFEWKVNPLRFHSLASGWDTWLTLILGVNE